MTAPTMTAPPVTADCWPAAPPGVPASRWLQAVELIRTEAAGVVVLGRTVADYFNQARKEKCHVAEFEFGRFGLGVGLRFRGRRKRAGRHA
jgi:hypothetical protein